MINIFDIRQDTSSTFSQKTTKLVGEMSQNKWKKTRGQNIIKNARQKKENKVISQSKCRKTCSTTLKLFPNPRGASFVGRILKTNCVTAVRQGCGLLFGRLQWTWPKMRPSISERRRIQRLEPSRGQPIPGFIWRQWQCELALCHVHVAVHLLKVANNAGNPQQTPPSCFGLAFAVDPKTCV